MADVIGLTVSPTLGNDRPDRPIVAIVGRTGGTELTETRPGSGLVSPSSSVTVIDTVRASPAWVELNPIDVSAAW